MSNEEIKKYDECNVDEKEVIDCFRKMKLMSDQARFELVTFKLENLPNKQKSIIQLLDKQKHLMCLKKLIKMIYPVQIQIMKIREKQGR